MGLFKKPMLAAAIVLAVLILSLLVERGQAGALQQTVPTVKPSATQVPPQPTATATTQPTATSLPVLQATATTAAGATLTPVELTATSVAFTLTQESKGAPSATAAMAATAAPTSEMTPTQTSTPPAAQGWMKSLYFLVCGLAVLAAIAIIILMAVRRAAQKTPPPGPAGKI